MRAALVAALLGALTLAATAGPASATRGIPGGPTCSFFTTLTPAEEVRTPANAADPTVESVAGGFASGTVNGNGTVTFFVVIVNPAQESFFAGHIHRGPAGTNGPVRVSLFDGLTNDLLLFFSGTAPISSADQAELCSNPANFYINFHTTLDPVGAVRGQLGD